MAPEEEPPEQIHTTTPTCPIFINTISIRYTITHPSLIHHIQSTLPTVSTQTQSPNRQHHSITPSSSLLLMPSWSLSPSLPYIGVKVVTSFPENSSTNLPGIHGSYILFDSITGRTLAVIDGTELTLWRTSCVCALGAKFLAREDSEVLLVVGAGALAPHMVRAHLSVLPSLKRVIVWNRTVEKARDLVGKLKEEMGSGRVWFECGECLEESVGVADVITCATNSRSALVKGEALKGGAHVGLVGSFTPEMRECDDETVKRGRVFVDCEGAMVEAGELVGAFERGVLRSDEIGGTLVELIKGEKVGRRGPEEITVFKSVGSAVVDIVTAQLVYESFLHNSDL
ncbi:hypothetical protein Sjap_020991 [Stephania japonica]|uniref:Uncharacterized protein n=1 Tax=Stephania japonica TaxID=461633 RepID=A0AAP0HZG8_9MAGN